MPLPIFAVSSPLPVGPVAVGHRRLRRDSESARPLQRRRHESRTVLMTRSCTGRSSPARSPRLPTVCLRDTWTWSRTLRKRVRRLHYFSTMFIATGQIACNIHAAESITFRRGFPFPVAAEGQDHINATKTRVFVVLISFHR